MRNIGSFLAMTACLAGYSCSDQKGSEYNHEVTASKADQQLPTFSSIQEAITSNGDFKGACFAMIDSSATAPVIRISSDFLTDEALEMRSARAKHDFVYTVFVTFAQTKLDTITIKSIPRVVKSFESSDVGKLDNGSMVSGTVTRERALDILKKNLSVKYFSDLYSFSDGTWTPNRHFDTLKDIQTELIYSYLTAEI